MKLLNKVLPTLEPWSSGNTDNECSATVRVPCLCPKPWVVSGVVVFQSFGRAISSSWTVSCAVKVARIWATRTDLRGDPVSVFRAVAYVGSVLVPSSGLTVVKRPIFSPDDLASRYVILGLLAKLRRITS